MKCKYKIENEIGINPYKDYFWMNKKTHDKREPLWKKQRKEYGFDDRELWNLDCTLVAFLYPRLIRFKEIKCSYPPNLTPEGWDSILDEIIDGFKIYLTEDFPKENESNKINKALDLLCEYFHQLWD